MSQTRGNQIRVFWNVLSKEMNRGDTFFEAMRKAKSAVADGVLTSDHFVVYVNWLIDKMFVHDSQKFSSVLKDGPNGCLFVSEVQLAIVRCGESMDNIGWAVATIDNYFNVVPSRIRLFYQSFYAGLLGGISPIIVITDVLPVLVDDREMRQKFLESIQRGGSFSSAMKLIPLFTDNEIEAIYEAEQDIHIGLRNGISEMLDLYDLQMI